MERTNERKVSWPVYEDALHTYANQNTNFEKRERKTWYHCGNELGSRLLRAFYIEADSIFIFLLQLNIDYDFCLFGF